MAIECFTAKKFKRATAKVIADANVILEEYAARGFTMTLRQLHYQFVARDLYANTQKNYKRLGKIMSDARLAGEADWDHMEDRVRSLARQPRWDCRSDIIAGCAQQYREDIWQGQDVRPEVWIEKDALIGVIEGVCGELRVDYFACRGNVSQSAQYEASKRFQRAIENGQEPIVFHLGDHDPSGIDMTRDNRHRFQLLTGESVKVERLALNHDQVRHYNPPPNPVKFTDSRAAGYVAQYGRQSWELDALEPDVIAALIRDAITPLIDTRAWDKSLREEKASRKILQDASERWEEVEEFLEKDK